MALFIEEKFVNATKGYRIGESGVYEPFTDDVKKLFKSLQKEHGRCISKCYLETKAGDKQIGWVFQKREKYTDSAETFVKETWVMLHEKEPETKTTFHYKYL